MNNSKHISKLTEQQHAVTDWLHENAPYTGADQHHLDASSPEQAYWHLGYQAALADVIKLLKGDDEIRRNEDMSK
ncbi:MAG: hypothetical protein AAFV69_07630 [Pseudomonadota bacterium]